MKLLILTITAIMVTRSYSHGQQALPYHEIPPAPQAYSAGNVLGRLVDGLGFRYYWATEGLRDADLNYQSTPEGRTIKQTLEHVYSLTLTVVNTSQNKASKRPEDWSALSFEELRSGTLFNLQQASRSFKSQGETELENSQIVFQREEEHYQFPLWNLINGPLADAIWHTGQVVMMRRGAGNPINPKVDVFRGKVSE